MLKSFWTIARNILLLCLIAFLAACATGRRDGPPPDADRIDVSKIPDAIPKPLPLCKLGNPPSYVIAGKRYHVMKSSVGYRKVGTASWYGTLFHKKRTSCGEPYNLYGMTAASKTLPIPTFVQVTNLENGRRVIVKVNDRGPFVDDRILDLSYVAAKKLGMADKGTALVEVVAINPYHPAMKKFSNPFSTLTLKHPATLFYLDVASFSHLTLAKKALKKVQGITKTHAFLSTQHNGLTYWYHIQVGPISNQNTADSLLRQLKQSGFREARFVKK